MIEGVGWNTGFLPPLFADDSFSYLQCFNNQGENLNPDLTDFEMLPNVEIEYIDECGELSTGIEGESYKNEITKIYPNPFEERLIVDSEERIREVIMINNLGDIIYKALGHVDQIKLDTIDSGVLL